MSFHKERQMDNRQPYLTVYGRAQDPPYCHNVCRTNIFTAITGPQETKL